MTEKDDYCHLPIYLFFVVVVVNDLHVFGRRERVLHILHSFKCLQNMWHLLVQLCVPLQYVHWCMDVHCLPHAYPAWQWWRAGTVLTWVERRQQIRQDHLETSALCESRQWGEQTVCAACLSIHTHDYILYRSAHRARQELQYCSFITVLTAKHLQYSRENTYLNTMRSEYMTIIEMALACNSVRAEKYFNSTCMRWCNPSPW